MLRNAFVIKYIGLAKILVFDAMLMNTLICTLLLSGFPVSAQRLMQENITMIPSASPSLGSVTFVDTVQPIISPVSQLPTTYPTNSPRSASPRSFPTPYPTNSLRPSYTRSYPTFPSPSGYDYYRPTYPPNYYRPSFPSGYYYGPTEPPESISAGLDASGIVIIVLVLITLLGICYGRSQFDQALSTEAVDAFIDNIYKKKWFVLQVPTSLTFDVKKITYTPRVLFFTTRIKLMWVKPLAILQFVIGWIACFASLVGFIHPDNVMNNNIGAAALFLSELILHIWYGYIRYWNPSWLFLQCDPDWEEDLEYASASLQGARKSCTQLFHVDREYVERETSQWIIVVGHIVSIPLHIGSVVGSCLACLALSVLAMVGCNKGGFQGNVRMIGIISAVIGSLAYPILFRRGDIFIKVLASIGHHVCLECYEARHFAKTPQQFLTSVIFKPLVDILAGEAEVPECPDLDDKEEKDGKDPVKKDQKMRNDGEEKEYEEMDLSGNTQFSSSLSEDVDPVRLSETNGAKISRDATDLGTEGISLEEVEKEIDFSSKTDVEEGFCVATAVGAEQSIPVEEDGIEVDIEIEVVVDASVENEDKECTDDAVDVETGDVADEEEIQVEAEIKVGEVERDNDIVIDGDDNTTDMKEGH